MKVYSCPNEVPLPEPDYSDWNNGFINTQKQELEHVKTLRQWLKDHGFTGKHTGDIFAMPMADGAAYYMIAEGSKSCLIHLPYGDGWDHQDARHIPKKEVIRRSMSFQGYYDGRLEWLNYGGEL